MNTVHRERVQEREVRLTAQRILAHHLRPGPDNPAATFWADIDLDLTAATLINFDLTGCTTRDASFTQATFTGHARFKQATFTGVAWFDGVTLPSRRYSVFLTRRRRRPSPGPGDVPPEVAGFVTPPDEQGGEDGNPRPE